MMESNDLEEDEVGREWTHHGSVWCFCKRIYTLFLFLLVGGYPAGLLHNRHRGRVKVVLVITDGAYYGIMLVVITGIRSA